MLKSIKFQNKLHKENIHKLFSKINYLKKIKLDKHENCTTSKD